MPVPLCAKTSRIPFTKVISKLNQLFHFLFYFFIIINRTLGFTIKYMGWFKFSFYFWKKNLCNNWTWLGEDKSWEKSAPPVLTPLVQQWGYPTCTAQPSLDTGGNHLQRQCCIKKGNFQSPRKNMSWWTNIGVFFSLWETCFNDQKVTV